MSQVHCIPKLSRRVEVWGVHNRLVYFPVVFQTPKKLLQTQAVPTIVWHSDTLPKETTDSHTCSQYEAGPDRSMLLGPKASFPIQVTEAPAPPLLAFPCHSETSLSVAWNSLLSQWCRPESSRARAACQESLSNGTLCSASFPLMLTTWISQKFVFSRNISGPGQVTRGCLIIVTDGEWFWLPCL